MGHVAYSDDALQRDIGALSRESDVAFLKALAPLVARVQAPVFREFGLPPGDKGVHEMKRLVALHRRGSPKIGELAGNLRELLGLQREEINMIQCLQGPSQGQATDMREQLRRAPRHAVQMLGSVLGLAKDASLDDVALAVPQMSQICRQRAEAAIATPGFRSSEIGRGKLIPKGMSDASDEEIAARITQDMERYMLKVLSRCLHPVTSYTSPPEAWACGRASEVVLEQHVRELWARDLEAEGSPDRPWASLGVGVTVIDGAFEAGLMRRAHAELGELSAQGRLSTSKDSCNTGARSVWLAFGTPEEQQKLSPALRDVATQLAGLPHALMQRAADCERGFPGSLAVPELRIHAHMMAAVYNHGAEYHGHKDSYDGVDNGRMLTVLLYANPDWAPGDEGELRVFGTTCVGGKASPDEERHVDIQPLPGRVVMFRSREVWHAVRMPRALRWAITLWVMAD